MCLSPRLKAISSIWADTLSRWQLIIVPIRRGGASVAASTRQITVCSNIPITFHVHHLTIRSWKECGCSTTANLLFAPETGKAISDRHHSFCFARLHTNEQSLYDRLVFLFSSGVPSCRLLDANFGRAERIICRDDFFFFRRQGFDRRPWWESGTQARHL
jgi:hypothetical protein